MQSLLHHAKFITSLKVSCLCNQHNYRYTWCVKLYTLTNWFISIFVTTAVLSCQHAIFNKQMYVNRHLHSTNAVIIWCLQKLLRKIKIKLMFCKPLFIVHGRVKGLFKVILEYKNGVPQLKNWAWHMHNKITQAPSFKSQCR